MLNAREEAKPTSMHNDKWKALFKLAFDRYEFFKAVYHEACHIRGLIAINMNEAFFYDACAHVWGMDRIRPEKSKSVYYSYSLYTAIDAYNAHIDTVIRSYRRELHNTKINKYPIIIDLCSAWDRYKRAFDLMYCWLLSVITCDSEYSD